MPEAQFKNNPTNDKCSHFSFVVKVHGVNNLLLSILHNFPNCSSNHVTSWERGNGKAVTFSCQERNIQHKTISLADSLGDFLPSALLNPPFRLTIWEYFSCCILSKALSTSSSVKSVKSSLLFRDWLARRVTLKKQLCMCIKRGTLQSTFGVNYYSNLFRLLKNKKDRGSKHWEVLSGIF